MSENSIPPPKSSKFPYVEEFLRFGQKRLGFSHNTIEAYEMSLKNFYDWLLKNRGHVQIAKVVKKDIFDYRDFLENSGYSVATVKAKLSPLRTFIVWMLQSEIIPEESDPWPIRLHVAGQSSPPTVVPTPEEIFQIRLKPRIKIEWAWLFELILSTGMRISEALQLRAGDFNFDKRPFDKELNRPSPYFAGHVNMQSNRFRTKNCTPRIVYFSQLCAHLTQEMFAKYNIHHDDMNTPILPWSRQGLQRWINDCASGVIDKAYNSAGTGLAIGEKQRDRYFLDVDLDQLNIDERLKKLIKSRQDEVSNIEDYKVNAAQPMRVRCRTYMGPHALRHSWTNFNYYRNPFGERNASDSLRLLLGHNGLSTLHVYLTKLNMLDNDGTWKRLWLGKPNDWSGINR